MLTTRDPDLPEETYRGRGSLRLLSGGWWALVQVEGANTSLEGWGVSVSARLMSSVRTRKGWV